MKYLNLPVSLSHDAMILRSTPEQIGVWFLLIAYCHAQMNGGCIKCCHEWPDEMWQRIAGTRAAVIAQDSPLWHFSSMVLIIHHYDQEAEDSYRKKQRMGRVYIERRWAAHRAKKIIQITSNGSGKPQKKSESQDEQHQQLNR